MAQRIKQRRSGEDNGCRTIKVKISLLKWKENPVLHLILHSVSHMCWECSESTREGAKQASYTKGKFLCSSHSCSMTLQMAVLPFVQPPGISPRHNGITSEKKTGKSDFISCSWGNICTERKRSVHKACGFLVISESIVPLEIENKIQDWH